MSRVGKGRRALARRNRRFKTKKERIDAKRARRKRA
jgi:hypothetical protein